MKKLPATVMNQENSQLSVTAGLRVAILSDAAPQRNGVGSYYADLLEHLEEHVEQVDLICPGVNGNSSCGRLVFSMPGDATQKLCFPMYRDFSRRLERLRPHVIIVPTPGPFGLLGIRWAKRLDARLITGFHTDFSQLTNLYYNRFLSCCGQQYLKLSHKLLFRYSAVILTTSQDMIKAAEEIGAGQVELMGTFIPARFLHSVQAPVPESLQRIIFVGRLAPEKNIQAILDSVRRLPELNFVIAGDGPLRNTVQEQAGKVTNLNYVDWQSRDNLCSLLDENDMLVLPSRVESFGTVALEAMARARNVLVSARCGLLHWPSLKDAVFTMAEDESLAQAIIRVRKNDPALLRQKALAGRRAAVDLNNWSLRHWLEILGRSSDGFDH